MAPPDAGFELHPQLEADCALVADLALCRVLLMDDANYPWLVLVPRRAGLRDWHDLAFDDLIVANEEIVRASRALVDLYNPVKTNVAALGNQVPQLHVHVVARFADDPAWPKPIWGAVPPQLYAPDALEARLGALRSALAG